jgi:predicted aspartyl protease
VIRIGASAGHPRSRRRLAAILAAFATAAAAAWRLEAAPISKAAPSLQEIQWPPGTVQLAFEDLDGAVLLRGTVTGLDGRDTTGDFVLDTGAGFIGLDEPLAVTLGIAARHSNGEIEFTPHPLPRFRLGDLDIQQAQALIFDAEVIRNVTDRPVLGLLGQQPMNDRALLVDYQAKRIVLVPAMSADPAAPPLDESRRIVSALVSSSAVALPFRVAAGGKVLVRVRVVPRQGTPSAWRTFVFDTGATKCALFVNGEDAEKGAARWRPALHALETPTLLGRSSASLIRAARLEVRGVADGEDRQERQVVAPNVDVLLVDSPLGPELSSAAGETVSGLLGYSFLRRFRVVCDYPHRVLWLDPVEGFRDDRPYEHSHAGIQLERQGGIVRVMSVARPSPAERAGIKPGDEVVAIGRTRAAQVTLTELGRLMEGEPGTALSLTIRRDRHEISYRLRRQRLL